jgi:hypothetical protein
MLTLRSIAIILAAIFIFTLLGSENSGIESPTGVDELSAEKILSAFFPKIMPAQFVACFVLRWN